MNPRHVALFFRHFRKDAGILYWVRAIVVAPDLPAEAARLGEIVCRTDKRFDLEYLGYGETELAVDEEYFRSGCATKRLVFLKNCQARYFDDAFGGTTDVNDEETVVNLFHSTLRLGEFYHGRYSPREPAVIERVSVTPAI